MGNKLGRKKQVVDEKYTRPQGLDFDIDVDNKKLRKLILESELAPCYPGDDDCCCDLEECPICFLYYPSLNRSRCCTKSICTECFLRMKNPNSACPTQCPFCKAPNYVVEYRGVKTKEEKGIEQIEEQRVIEAQLRMRQQELQDEEERMQRRQELSSSSGIAPGEVQYCSVAARSSGVEEVVSSQASQAASMVIQPLNIKSNRDDEFDLDLEDIMVTEAIWQSIQENGRLRNSNCGDVASSVQYISGDRYISPSMTTVAGSSSSASDRLVCTVAAFTEHQQMTGEPSSSYNFNIPAFNMFPSSGRFYNRLDPVADSHLCPQSQVDMSADGGMISAAARDDEEWDVDHRSEMGEAGTSYANSDARENGVISTIPQDEVRDGFRNVPEPIVPESYEEQMMMAMAMAISLGEGRAMTRGLGISWQ